MTPRQITTTVTMLVLCLVLALGAVWGWRSLFAPLPGISGEPDAAACTTETVDPGQRIRSSQVKVSVFNAGDRSGLADKVRTALSKRGFKPGEVGNAPGDSDIGSVEVWSTEKKDAKAALVARQFGAKLRVRVTDTDLGPGVDVIVGNGFDKLVKAKRSIRVRASQDVCVRPEGSAN